MGEDRETKQTWSNGRPTDSYPPVGLIGAPECIGQGEPEPLPEVAREYRGGWDLRCYSLFPPQPMPIPLPVVPAVPFAVDVRDCRTQQAFAAIEQALYVGNGSSAETLLSQRYPGIITYLVGNSFSDTPGSLIGVLGNTTLVFVSGTTNPQQWALQGMFGVTGQESYGTFSTLPLWRSAAEVIIARVENTVAVPTGPIVLVGHSYGGAVAAIMAVRYQIGNSGRNISMLSFGMPAPGDSRLAGYLREVEAVHLVNDNDPVPYLPPGREELAGVSFLIFESTRMRWLSYVRPSGRIGLSVDGLRTDNPDSGNVYGLLWRFMRDFSLGLLPGAIFAHDMAEYRRRIICPGDPSPSPIPPVSAPGPLVLGGESTFDGSSPLSAPGPLVLGGESTFDGSSPLSAPGPLVLGGESTFDGTPHFEGQGGCKIGSESDINV